MKTKLLANRENWPVLSSCCEEYLRAQGCDNRQMVRLLIAIEEIFINVASYAYGKKEGYIVIELNKRRTGAGRSEITVRIEDEGVPFDPVAYIQNKDKDLKKQATDLIPGGLGIYLVNSSMEGLCYHRREGRNILTFHKTIQTTEKPEEHTL